MENPHPHAAALEQLGYEPIRARLGVTRQTWRNWKRGGVPKPHREIVAILCAISGIATKEIMGE